MGTGGVKLIRDRGYYHLWYRNWDGYPEEPGLGVETYRMVPTDPGQLDSWVADTRKQVVELRHAYYAQIKKLGEKRGATVRVGEEFVAIRESWNYEGDLYIYEIDLDNMLFLFQKYPVYHLNNMPPEHIFLRSCAALDNVAKLDYYQKFYNDTPKEYRVDLSRIGKSPAVGKRKLASYKKRCTGVAVDPYSILSLPGPDLTLAEDLSLRLMADYIHFYLEEKLLVIYHGLVLCNEEEGLAIRSLEIAWLFAAMALFPLHILGSPSSCSQTRFLRGAHEPFWFIRKHICVTIGVHLLDEGSAASHIVALVDKIISTPACPDVTYGVVFSLLHCIIVRVDKAAGGHFSRTEVLQFLPSPIQGPHITPGMQIMVRLGQLSSADDIQVFYSHLCPRWWVENRYLHRPDDSSAASDDSSAASDDSSAAPDVSSAAPDVSSAASEGGIPPRLPFELLMMIASEIERPENLFDFALASKTTMAAAMPRLRLPQVQGTDRQQYKEIRVMLSSRSNDKFPTKFGWTYHGQPARVALIHGNIVRCCKDWHMSLAVYVAGKTMPRANMVFDCGSDPFAMHLGVSRELIPHVELGFITWWHPEMVKKLRESVNKHIAKNGGTIPNRIKEAIESPDDMFEKYGEEIEDEEDANGGADTGANTGAGTGVGAGADTGADTGADRDDDGGTGSEQADDDDDDDDDEEEEEGEEEEEEE